jgi:hypothetical protein
MVPSSNVLRRPSPSKYNRNGRSKPRHVKGLWSPLVVTAFTWSKLSMNVAGKTIVNAKFEFDVPTAGSTTYLRQKVESMDLCADRRVHRQRRIQKTNRRMD